MIITIASVVIAILFIALLLYARRKAISPNNLAPPEIKERELPIQDTIVHVDEPQIDEIIAPASAPQNSPAMVILDYRNRITRHPTKRYGVRPLNRITQLIIHHSATMQGSAEAYARYHVNDLGWPGIGYHFVIEKDGSIKQTNSLDTISYQVSGQNTASIGICCTGHYDHQVPPQEQLNSLVWLLKRLKGEFPGAQINGHRDFSSKTCPGNLFPFNQVVSSVQAIENSPESGGNNGFLAASLLAMATAAIFLR